MLKRKPSKKRNRNPRIMSVTDIDLILSALNEGTLILAKMSAEVNRLSEEAESNTVELSEQDASYLRDLTTIIEKIGAVANRREIRLSRSRLSEKVIILGEIYSKFSNLKCNRDELEMLINDLAELDSDQKRVASKITVDEIAKMGGPIKAAGQIIANTIHRSAEALHSVGKEGKKNLNLLLMRPSSTREALVHFVSEIANRAWSNETVNAGLYGNNSKLELTQAMGWDRPGKNYGSDLRTIRANIDTALRDYRRFHKKLDRETALETSRSRGKSRFQTYNIEAHNDE